MLNFVFSYIVEVGIFVAVGFVLIDTKLLTWGQLFKAGLKFKANSNSLFINLGNISLEILSESVGVFFSDVLK
jgi:hypothetical protein